MTPTPRYAFRAPAALVLLALGTACAGPWWGPSGDVRVTWRAGQCTVAFTHAGHTESVRGVTHAQPVGGLSCVAAPTGRVLVYVHFDPTLAGGAGAPGRYQARVWGAGTGAGARTGTPGTFVLATQAFGDDRSVRQLESVSGELRLVQWPVNGRDSAAVEATARVRVHTGIKAP